MGLQSNHLKVDGRLNRDTRIAWQSELKRLGKYQGVLDGIIGPMTIRAIQKWVNDGKIKYGVNDSEHFIAETGRMNDQTRRAVQRKLGVRPIDGIWGRITISALQTHLNGVTRG
jgi:peptidoglycan hydrolase-like protein with peptidoglycan-binding domain